MRFLQRGHFGMILSSKHMNSGPMRDDLFFTAGALRYSRESCNLPSEGSLQLQTRAMADAS
jgi:hypothetical protein